jgi:hypothetical protein
VRYFTLLQKFAIKCNHGSKVNESQSLQPKDSVLARFSKSTTILVGHIRHPGVERIIFWDVEHSALAIKYSRFQHQATSNFSTLHWRLRIFLQPLMLLFIARQLSTILDISFCRAHYFLCFLRNSPLFKPFREFHIFSMLYSIAMASLFTCIFEKFVRLAMDNEASVVHSCLNCVREESWCVYSLQTLQVCIEDLSSLVICGCNQREGEEMQV